VNIKGLHEGTEWRDKAVGSVAEYRFDLLPAQALAAVAELRANAVAKHGEQGIESWMASDPAPHVNKAIAHIYAYLSGDTTEARGDPAEHLTHALCRLMFAVHIERSRQDDRR
jgi:hypothetical protein